MDSAVTLAFQLAKKVLFSTISRTRTILLQCYPILQPLTYKDMNFEAQKVHEFLYHVTMSAKYCYFTRNG